MIKNTLKLFLVNLLVFVVLLEISCRTIPFLKNYCIVADFESTNSYYKTIKKRVTPGKYSLYKTNEFSYLFTMNKLGLFDNEVEDPEIVGLGDSFTQGVGTPPDSTWLKSIERKTGKKTLNAGIGGSNPEKEYVLLQSLYATKTIRPKLLIETINSTDIFDIAMNEQGFYSSYSFASIFLYKLFTLQDWKRLYLAKEKKYSSTHEKIYTAVLNMDKLCVENGCTLVVVFNPIQDDILNNWSFDSLITKISQKNIPVIDLKKEFEKDGRITKKTVQNYYWQTDGHHNTKGYSIMGEIIANKISGTTY